MTSRAKSHRKMKVESCAGAPTLFGYLRGTMEIPGDIVSPDPEPWNSDLGIAYRDENGMPVYEVGDEIETEDEFK